VEVSAAPLPVALSVFLDIFTKHMALEQGLAGVGLVRGLHYTSRRVLAGE
jgi:hypothetical protein